MTSLRQSLQERRATDVAACVVAEDRQPALVVSNWQGDSWVLPWSHLVSARQTTRELELTFSRVVVLLTGENLSLLLEDIAAFRLGRLRGLPPDYHQAPGEGQPFIIRIEVRPADSPPNRESPA